MQSPSSTSVGFLLAGLVLAILFGLLGDILGKLEHQDAIKKKGGKSTFVSQRWQLLTPLAITYRCDTMALYLMDVHITWMRREL